MVEDNVEANPKPEEATSTADDANGQISEHGTDANVPNGDNSGSAPRNDGEDTAVTVVDESLPPSKAGSMTASTPPSTPDGRDGLRRASSKIANLRAAFEKQNGGPTSPSLEVIKLRYERSPARVNGDEAETPRLKEAHELELATLKKQQEKELASLREELRREQDTRQALDQKCSSLEQTIEGLKQGTVDQGNELRNDLEQKNAELSREKTAAQEDASNAQRLLLELKRNISSATRIETQESDSAFAEQMQNLYHETQNWVVANFRKVKVECPASEMCARLESIAEPRQLEMLRPVFQAWEPSIKVAAFQSTVVSYLMEIFSEPLLFGLPSQEDWRRHVKKASDTLPDILSPASFNKWRSTTLDAIRQSESISESVEAAARNMSEMICITLSTLSEADESQARSASLNIIIKRAIALAHLFKVQRAQYEFTLPAPGSQFLVASMEDTDDSEASSDRFVRCGTFPAVVKLGDEHGDNLDLFNVIAKAKVLCNG